MSDYVEMQNKFIKEKLAEPNSYRLRYVAFLDLLGFKDITREQDCASIKAFFNDIELIKYSFDAPLGDSIFGKEFIEDTEFTIMSDSIVIATEDSYAGLSYLLFLCATIQSRLLTSSSQSLVLRGGISYGNYFKLHDLSFGPAMTAACLLENQAVNPRVLVDPEIIKRLRIDGIIGQTGIDQYFAELDPFEIMIKQFLTTFDDDFYFVDYFNPMELLRLSNSKNFAHNPISTIQQTLQKGINSENERVRQKYIWLRSFFNYKMRNSFFPDMSSYVMDSEAEI